MSTEEWVDMDSLIWDYDFEDDFIWVPAEDSPIGVGTWVANKRVWMFVADKETFTYVAYRR